jgi:hypothetical protein
MNVLYQMNAAIFLMHNTNAEPMEIANVFRICRIEVGREDRWNVTAKYRWFDRTRPQESTPAAQFNVQSPKLVSMLLL